jgi:hypothetical protein
LALPSRQRVCGPVHELLHVDQLQCCLHCIRHLLLRQLVPAANQAGKTDGQAGRQSSSDAWAADTCNKAGTQANMAVTTASDTCCSGSLYLQAQKQPGRQDEQAERQSSRGA